MVDEYLMIEKIRFEERLQVATNIAEDSKAAHLPRMLLQTLIETPSSMASNAPSMVALSTLTQR